MKIRVYDKPSKEVIASDQKDLEVIFGKCFLAFSDLNSYSGNFSFSDILVYSRHENVQSGCHDIYGISNSYGYEKEELDKFVLSETLSELENKKVFLKHRIKKII